MSKKHKKVYTTLNLNEHFQFLSVLILVDIPTGITSSAI